VSNIDAHPGEYERPWYKTPLGIGITLLLFALLALGTYLCFAYFSRASATTQSCNISVHEHSVHDPWTRAGADPFVPFGASREERRAKAEASDACVLAAEGAPQPVITEMLKHIAANPDGDAQVHIDDGVRYLGLSFGGQSVNKNMVVRLGRKVHHGDVKRKAAEWTVYDDQGNTWVYDRFGWWCMNSCLREKIKKQPPPTPYHSRHAYVPPSPVVQQACYKVPYDYTSTPEVDVHDGSVHHEVHLNGLTAGDMRSVIANPCTFAHDEMGDHKLVFGCDCDEGTYPPEGLATANDLPGVEPPAVAHWTGGKKGYISYPLGLYNAGLYCVRVEHYNATTEGFEAFNVFSRWDTVSSADMRETQAAGQLDWALTGSHQF
jgi:hypothetical protein